MKNIYLLLICITLFSCKKKEPDYTGKKITVSGQNAKYDIRLEYSGSQLVSAVPTNSAKKYSFSYSTAGALTKIVETGSETAVYDITYNGTSPSRTDRKVSGTLNKYYTYQIDRGTIIKIMVHDPATNAVVETHNSQYQGSYLSAITSPTTRSFLYKSQGAPTTLSQWLIPDFPVVLMQIPQLEKEVYNGTEITYTYNF